MKKGIVAFLLITALGHTAVARDWFASPDATINGDGSATNPWPLQIALTQSTVIRPGDTLYLRAGTYHGPFVSSLNGTSNNYVTVRSALGEWAVIKDPLNGVLKTNLTAVPARVDNVPVSGSQYWPDGTDAIVGSETLHLYTKRGTNWSIERGWNGSAVTSHSSGEELKPRMDFLKQSGSYVIFRDFEITSDLATNRIVGTSNWLGSGLNILSSGVGNKAVNLIIHDVGHPGIGFWEQGDGGEINGCLIWGNGMYDRDGTWTRGSGIYTQNHAGHVIIKNNIIFDNITEGTHAYGQAATASGYRFINNVYLKNANRSQALLIGTTAIPTSDNAVWTNYFMMNTAYFGYQTLSNTDLSCVGNTFVSSSPLSFVHQISGSVRNNTLLLDGIEPRLDNHLLSFICPEANKNDLSFSFDHNSYFAKNAQSYQFGFRTADITNSLASDHTGKAKWSDGTNSWTSWTGWDRNSTYQASWPTNFLKIAVHKSDYDSNRWHVVVVSTSGQTNATMDLSKHGFQNGNKYRLRDAQDYFRVVASGIFSPSAPNLELPLDLTNIVKIEGVRDFTPSHSNSEYPGLFNVFVLQRIASDSIVGPGNLHVISE